MHISMNGPTGPMFPLPTWVLVDENSLWSAGLPAAVPNLNNPTVCNGNTCFAIFSSQEQAKSFAELAGMSGLRPLALSDVIVFVALLTSRLDVGVRHVVLYTPGMPGTDMFECDAVGLLQRLSDAASRPRS